MQHLRMSDLVKITQPCTLIYGAIASLFFQNIVSTVSLGCKLDLKKIALHARNAEYNPKRFAAVIMRIREPRTTVRFRVLSVSIKDKTSKNRTPTFLNRR